MTGKSTSASAACVHVLSSVSKDIEQFDQKLHQIQHELQLAADLAGSSNQPLSSGLVSLDTLSIVLAGWAEQISALREDLSETGVSAGQSAKLLGGQDES